MNKFRSYKKQKSPLYYQSGGFNMDFFKNIAGNWKNFMKDPESAQSQGYIDDLVNRNKNIATERKTVQDKLILPDNEFSEWGDQADQAYTQKIWEKNYASTYGDWKSLSQDQQYDAWKKHKYSRPGWFNDTELGDDLHQSGAMFDKDKATRTELGEVNKKLTSQLAETGAGIFSIMDAQKAYDNKPQEKFSLDFGNDKGIMRSQMGSFVPRAQQGYGYPSDLNKFPYLEDVIQPDGISKLPSQARSRYPYEGPVTSNNKVLDDVVYRSDIKSPKQYKEKLSKDEVKVIQRQLNRQNNTALKEDGKLGPETLEAIEKYKIGKVPDAKTANRFRSALGFLPKNVRQLAAKEVLGDARMDDESLSAKEKKVLYDVIRNAQKRVGGKKGGTEYEDYGDLGYGSKEEFNENFNKGKAGDSIFKLVKESYSNPGFALASTVGRGSFDEDEDYLYYTDVYDWNKSESNYKDDNLYKKIRNSVRDNENIQDTNNKFEKYRMNFKLKKADFENYIDAEPTQTNQYLTSINNPGIRQSGGASPMQIGVSGPEGYKRIPGAPVAQVAEETVSKPPVDIVRRLQQHPYNYTFPSDFDTFSAGSQKALVDSYIANFNEKQVKGLDAQKDKTGYDPRQLPPVETITTPFTTTLNASDNSNSADEQDAWFAEQIKSGKEGTVQYFNGKPIKIQRSSGYKKRTDTMNSKGSTQTGLAKDIYNKPQSLKSGGIPTSPLGLYKYPGQTVNVPSGNITMQGINHPVLAIPNSDKPEVMYPGRDYQFQNSSSVLEVPMMQSGGDNYSFPNRNDYVDDDNDDLDDEDVKNQIKKHEGAVIDKYGKHVSYADSRGFKTIGYGHLWKKGDPKSLTQRQAEELFNKDYRIHKKHAENIPGYHKATPNQKKALINLTYNMGADWYKKFPKFTKAFEEGNHIEAANQLRDSAWAKQVGKRSDEVIDTFLSVDYPKTNNFDRFAQESPATIRYEENVDPLPETESDLQSTQPTQRAFDFLSDIREDHKGFFEGLDFSSVYNDSDNTQNTNDMPTEYKFGGKVIKAQAGSPIAQGFPRFSQRLKSVNKAVPRIDQMKREQSLLLPNISGLPTDFKGLTPKAADENVQPTAITSEVDKYKEQKNKAKEGAFDYYQHYMTKGNGDEAAGAMIGNWWKNRKEKKHLAKLAAMDADAKALAEKRATMQSAINKGLNIKRKNDADLITKDYKDKNNKVREVIIGDMNKPAVQAAVNKLDDKGTVPGTNVTPAATIAAKADPVATPVTSSSSSTNTKTSVSKPTSTPTKKYYDLRSSIDMLTKNNNKLKASTNKLKNMKPMRTLTGGELEQQQMDKLLSSDKYKNANAFLKLGMRTEVNPLRAFETGLGIGIGGATGGLTAGGGAAASTTAAGANAAKVVNAGSKVVKGVKAATNTAKVAEKVTPKSAASSAINNMITKLPQAGAKGKDYITKLVKSGKSLSKKEISNLSKQDRILYNNLKNPKAPTTPYGKMMKKQAGGATSMRDNLFSHYYNSL